MAGNGTPQGTSGAVNPDNGTAICVASELELKSEGLDASPTVFVLHCMTTFATPGYRRPKSPAAVTVPSDVFSSTRRFAGCPSRTVSVCGDSAASMNLWSSSRTATVASPATGSAS